MDASALRAECLELLETMNELPGPSAERLRADRNADLDLASLTFDSLTLLDFCLRLEDRTGIEVEPADVYGVTTLNELVKSLAARGVQ